MVVPELFCWTKVGTEAGEPVPSIVARKEGERAASDGLFLWGIGNSVWPSLAALVREEARPTVVFSPMLSAPAGHDVAPGRVVRWTSAEGARGERFLLPPSAVVTSRAGAGWRAGKHFALVCHSGVSLDWDDEARSSARIDESSLRNLRSGARLGASQVTSVVKRVAPSEGGRYSVALRAQLVPPYLVVLSEAEVVAAPDLLDRSA